MPRSTLFLLLCLCSMSQNFEIYVFPLCFWGWPGPPITFVRQRVKIQMEVHILLGKCLKVINQGNLNKTRCTLLLWQVHFHTNLQGRQIPPWPHCVVNVCQCLVEPLPPHRVPANGKAESHSSTMYSAGLGMGLGSEQVAENICGMHKYMRIIKKRTVVQCLNLPLPNPRLRLRHIWTASQRAHMQFKRGRIVW